MFNGELDDAPGIGWRIAMAFVDSGVKFHQDIYPTR
jgi:hypothetical protein